MSTPLKRDGAETIQRVQTVVTQIAAATIPVAMRATMIVEMALILRPDVPSERHWHARRRDVQVYDAREKIAPA